MSTVGDGAVRAPGASFDGIITRQDAWALHLWIGVALGDLAGAALIGYFAATLSGVTEASWVAFIVVACFLNLGVAYFGQSVRSSRARSILLRAWVFVALLLVAVCSSRQDNPPGPITFFLALPVLYASATCSPRWVGMFTGMALAVVGSFLMLDRSWAADQLLVAEAVALICLLAVGASVTLRRQERILERLHALLAEEALTDSLTGLDNRRAFDSSLEDELNRWHRTDAGFLLAALDLNGFKMLNDTRGHHAGDEMLRSVARSLVKALRRIDVVARVGGDEFSVLLPHTQSANVEEVTQRLRDAVQAADPNGQVSVSIGIVSPLPAETASELMTRADQAMYEDKRRGTDRG